MKRKILRRLAEGTALSLVLFATGCASTPTAEPVIIEEAQPVAVTEFKMNKYLDFFKKKNMISEGNAAVGKAAGGGLLGAIASGLTNKAQKEVYSYLYTEKFMNDFHVEQIVLEELAKFPEIKEFIPADKILSVKDYSKIKNQKDSDTVRNMPVGNFKYFGDEKDRSKKIQNARAVLEKNLGANGFAEIYVYFGYYLSETDEVLTDFQKSLDKAANALDDIESFFSGQNKKKEADTGYLHPAVYVWVRIFDKNGVPFSFPNKYQNGMEIKGYETAQEAKKAKGTFNLENDYYYRGSAVGSQSVVLNKGNYNGEDFYKLYTEDLVRKAARNAVLRASED